MLDERFFIVTRSLLLVKIVRLIDEYIQSRFSHPTNRAVPWPLACSRPTVVTSFQ